MFAIRPLSFRDVVTALKLREPAPALHISHNLCTNAVSSARMRWPHALATRRPTRRAA